MGGATWSSSLVLATVAIRSAKSQIVARTIKNSVKNYQGAIKMLASSVCVCVCVCVCVGGGGGVGYIGSSPCHN